MAPTEVLARQHYLNISRYLAPTGVACSLLIGSTTKAERKPILKGLEDGSIGIIIGTHALIEDPVIFRNLGLAVIDEQHRFGVEQRSRLWAKGRDGIPPHVLVMTATPIPRTLAMTLYGDLDVSVIDEMPPGRKPVKTILIGEGKKPVLYNFMKNQIAKGRQVFIVYPLIFESEKMDYRNLEAGYEEIVTRFPLPQYKVAIVHGQQTSEVKKLNMDAFAAGRADILVSTTVIEVGVDVPNATVIVIESAERFGLAQLHQLRGRVGRGSDESFCVLVHGTFTDYTGAFFACIKSAETSGTDVRDGERLRPRRGRPEDERPGRSGRNPAERSSYRPQDCIPVARRPDPVGRKTLCRAHTLSRPDTVGNGKRAPAE